MNRNSFRTMVAALALLATVPSAGRLEGREPIRHRTRSGRVILRQNMVRPPVRNRAGNSGLPSGRVYYNGRYYGNFNNRYFGPQYGYF